MDPSTVHSPHNLTDIWQMLQNTSHDVMGMLELAEHLITIYYQRTLSRHDETYAQSAQAQNFIQTLLNCVPYLLEFFDSMRSVIYASGIPSVSAAQPADAALFGIQPGARINHFVLDETERNLLLQEIFRETVVSIAKILEEVHLCVSLAVPQPGEGWQPIPSLTFPAALPPSSSAVLCRLLGKCSKLLERTYSTLSHYGSTASL